MEAQGTAVVDALENMSGTVEGLISKIERIRETNLGEVLAARFGNLTLDTNH